MTPEQIVVLAIVQGITEFLPISSSGHLILIPAVTGWPDQGLATDVMVHVGSLFAVLAYFWRDCLGLLRGCWSLVCCRITDEGRMAIYILLATIPAVIFGLYLKMSGTAAMLRSVEIIAWNAIIFGVLLYVADLLGKRLKQMEDMTLAPAMVIGVAQALALIPGTSRSGITMTAARMLGFERPEAARFSFFARYSSHCRGRIGDHAGIHRGGAGYSVRCTVGRVPDVLFGSGSDRDPDGSRKTNQFSGVRDIPVSAWRVVVCAALWLDTRR